MTSRSTFLITILTLAIAIFGCDKKESKTDAGQTSAANADAGADSGPQIVFAEGPKPTSDTVIATSGDIEVTWDDYQHAIRVGRLFAPTLPDGTTEELSRETLATPHMHTVMTRSLLSRTLVMKEVERRGIEIPEEEVEAFLREQERLSRWGQYLGEPEKLEEELGKLGVTVEDFKRVGREQLAQKKLQEALLDEIDAESLWEAYRYENNTVRLLAASALNVPSSEELDDFVENRGDDIVKFFEEQESRYTYPARGEATVITGKEPDSVSEGELQKVAKELQKKGADPEAIAQKHGLVAKKRELFTRTEDQSVFAAKLGETGVTFGSPRGSYAWRKTAEVPPTVRELSFGLKREIAAGLLRSEVVSSEAKEKLAVAREKFEGLDIDFNDVEREEVEPALEELRELGLDAKLTPAFPRAQNGFVPGFGINEPVAIAAFNATREDPYPDEPILSRDRAFTFRLVGRTEPTREAFEKEKEAFAEQYREKAKRGIVDQFIQETFGKKRPNLNLNPIRVVYGETRKPNE